MASFQYRPAIDGLRAVAVLSVFIFHLSRRWLPGGFVGVDIFFVISGYLITSIIARDCRADKFSLAAFYQRRIARIFPAFFVVALATVAGSAMIYLGQDLASAGANLVAATLSVANLKFMLQGNYFQLSPDAQPFLHYWSLSVEEQFYMFFPLLFMLLFRYARRHLVLILSLLVSASLLACVMLTSIRPAWAFYLLPTRAWEMGAGCLLALTPAAPFPRATPRVVRSLPLVGLLLIAASCVFIEESPRFPGWLAVLPVAGTVAVILPCAECDSPVEKWLSTGLLVLVGRMSYSLYLWHWPVFSLVDYHLFLAPDSVRLGSKIGISFAATGVSFLLVENPMRAFLNQRERRVTAFVSMGVAVAVCVVLGMSIRRTTM